MKKVLIIDDDEGILDAISLLLLDSGYAVETTTKGEESSAKALSFRPDLILLDILMSGHDGRHICKKLKQDPKTKAIPIIMISAHPSANQGATDAGADAFLAKPFDTDELLRVVEEMLQ